MSNSDFQTHSAPFPARRHRRSSFQAFALGVIPLLLLLLSGELVLRWAALQRGEEARIAEPHGLTASAVDDIDSLDHEFSRIEESYQGLRPLRILWIGASHVYGIGAPPHQSVTEQMEVMLREQWRGPVKVHKVAHIGMGSTGLVQKLGVALGQIDPTFVLFWGGDANSIDYHGRRRWLAHRSATRRVVDFLSEWSRLVKFTDMLFRYEEHEYASSIEGDAMSEISQHPLTGKWHWMGNLMPWETYARVIQPQQTQHVFEKLRQGQIEFPQHLGFFVAEANLTSQTPSESAESLLEQIDRAFERAQWLSRRPILIEMLIEKILERDSRGEGLRLTIAQRSSLETRLAKRPRDELDLRIQPWIKRFIGADYSFPKGGLSANDRKALEVLLEWMPELFGPGFLLATERLVRRPQDAVSAWHVYEQNLMANPYPPLNTHATLLPRLVSLVSPNNAVHTRQVADRIHTRFPGLFDLLVSDDVEKRAWLKSDLSEAKAWVEHHNQRRPLGPRTQLIIVGFQPNRLNGKPTRVHSLLESIAQELELPFLDTFKVIHDAARADRKPVDAFFTQQYGPRDHHLNERGYQALARASLELPPLSVYLAKSQQPKSPK